MGVKRYSGALVGFGLHLTLRNTQAVIKRLFQIPLEKRMVVSVLKIMRMSKTMDLFLM